MPAGDVVRYAAWMAAGVTLPGTLLWRAGRGTPRSFVEDVAGGAALGVAMQILIYIPLRWLGAPALIVAWPVAVVAAFAGIPRLRKHWRPRDLPRAPAGWSWAVAILTALIFAWMAFSFFRTHPMTGPVAATPYVDMPYHLALAGEIKHHMPPTWPYVLSEPLHHHWFAQADIAASSWATGLEMRMILLRLQLFPLLAIAITLTAVTASRVARRWWPGPVAIIAGWFASAFTPYLWAAGDVFADQRLLSPFHWQSPSSLVGAAVFAGAALLAVDRLRDERPATGQWVLLCVLLAASMGAKSTLLPLTLAGAWMTALVRIAQGRGIGRSTLGLLVAGTFFMGVSAALIYGAEPYGLEWKPLDFIRKLPLPAAVGLRPAGSPELPLPPVLAVAAMALIAWLARGAPAAGLLRGKPRDSAIPFLAGMVAAGVATAVLFTHPGTSQVYFLRSAFPFLGVLAAAGLAAMVPRERPGGPILMLLAIAAAGGAMIAWLAGLGQPSPPSLAREPSRAAALLQTFKPMLAFAAACGAITVALSIARVRAAGLRGITAALIACIVAGAGLTPTVREVVRISETLTITGLTPPPDGTNGRTIPAEAIAAARWLRAHSTPGQIVATNVHCRVFTGFGCENRHFWISAYTERRVLVEGWGYTGFAMRARNRFTYARFRDPDRLTDNDRAFATPSSATVGLLRRRYGVTWLFVDERYDTPDRELSAYADLRYRNGPFVVYRI